jgi:hypothetical protein
MRAHHRVTGVKPTSEGVKSFKSFKEEIEEPILDELINEVLGKDASAGDWIHDFVHSDNPKFKGKSKAKRKEMALAAYYAKQRNEEIEQIVENQHKEISVTSEVEDGSHQDKRDTQELHNRIKAAAKEHGGKITYQDKPSLSGSHVIRTAGPGEFHKKVKEIVGDYEHLGAQHEMHEEIELNEVAKWRKTPIAKKVTNPNNADSVSYDYHQDHPRSTGMMRATSDTDPKYQSLNTRTKAQIASSGIRKGMITKQHGERLKNKIKTSLQQKEEVEVEESANPFSPDYKSQMKAKPGEKAGFDSKKISTGTVYSKKYKAEPEDDKKKVNEMKRPESDTVPFVSDVPFEGPYKKSGSDTVVDKSGAKHTPLSRVRHLAKQAMKKVKTEMLGKTGTSE